jgi:hypothetical protein
MEVDIDSCPIFSDSLIQKNMSLWQQFAESPDEVDLFDKATWPEGRDFSALVEVVMTEIAPLASHQQRLENYMQMAGRVAQTGVEEKRCTWRAILQISFMRTFNEFVLGFVNAPALSEEEKEDTTNSNSTSETEEKQDDDTQDLTTQKQMLMRAKIARQKISRR